MSRIGRMPVVIPAGVTVAWRLTELPTATVSLPLTVTPVGCCSTRMVVSAYFLEPSVAVARIFAVP